MQCTIFEYMKTHTMKHGFCVAALLALCLSTLPACSTTPDAATIAAIVAAVLDAQAARSASAA